MADFEVKIVKLNSIVDHPNADRLDICKIGDYNVISVKRMHSPGDEVAYIPEQSILPDWLIEDMGLVGKLSGSKKNRVKAIKLRGVLSQGLIYSLERIRNRFPSMEFTDNSVGLDVTRLMGIEKYEPRIPMHMEGEVCNAQGSTLKYDIENLKKYPDVFEEGEEVVITEKLHGTLLLAGWHHQVGAVISSKGFGAKGLMFKDNEVNNAGNLYVIAAKQANPSGMSLMDCLKREYDALSSTSGEEELAIYALGEIVGRGIQDLQYGALKPAVHLFDVYVGIPGHGEFLDSSLLGKVSECWKINSVPQLYKGEFSKEVVQEYTDGRETVSGTDSHVREGVVIRPTKERWDRILGRVILKSISEHYLLRKGGTEFS